MKMKMEYKKTAICPECKNSVTLDKAGNHKEKHIQCTNSKCTQIFKNKYFSGEQDETTPNYCG